MSALLSPAELAAELGVHRETIYRLSKRNLIPFVRVGWKYKYKLADVLKALAERDPRLAQSLQDAQISPSAAASALL